MQSRKFLAVAFAASTLVALFGTSANAVKKAKTKATTTTTTKPAPTTDRKSVV